MLDPAPRVKHPSSLARPGDGSRPPSETPLIPRPAPSPGPASSRLEGLIPGHHPPRRRFLCLHTSSPPKGHCDVSHSDPSLLLPLPYPHRGSAICYGAWRTFSQTFPDGGSTAWLRPRCQRCHRNTRYSSCVPFCESEFESSTGVAWWGGDRKRLLPHHSSPLL